jgi:hypothetical protein
MRYLDGGPTTAALKENAADSRGHKKSERKQPSEQGQESGRLARVFRGHWTRRASRPRSSVPSFINERLHFTNWTKGKTYTGANTFEPEVNKWNAEDELPSSSATGA